MSATLEQALAAALDSGEAPATAAQREAFERFSASGIPTTRAERWRYTDLKSIRDGEFDFTPPPPDARSYERAAALLAAAGLCGGEPCAVFVDGHYAAALSRPHAHAALAMEPPVAARPRPARSDPRGTPTEHPLAWLNAALARAAATIRVPANGTLAAPLHLAFVGSGTAGLAVQPRVAIALDAGAKLTVVTHFIDLPGGGGWTNAVIDIVQGAGSELALYRLQEHGEETLHTSLVTAELGADARLTGGFFDVGGRLVRHDIDVRLRARGARAELFGVALAFAGQHVDDHVRIDHAAPDTYSEEVFRSIIGEKGRGVFNGKVVVHPDAQGIDARQRSDNLLLGEQAEIDTKPELEIYADNVKCSHGATVGALDEEQLFYLRARGIDEAAARGLLTFAFANAVVARIGVPELKARVERRVAARLPDHEQWEALS